jgi:hypothetical protein
MVIQVHPKIYMHIKKNAFVLSDDKNKCRFGEEQLCSFNTLSGALWYVIKYWKLYL